MLFKVKCHEIFCFPENNLRAISIFFSRKFAEIFAGQGAPPVSTTQAVNLPPTRTANVVATSGKLAEGVCEFSKNSRRP